MLGMFLLVNSGSKRQWNRKYCTEQWLLFFYSFMWIVGMLFFTWKLGLLMKKKNAEAPILFFLSFLDMDMLFVFFCLGFIIVLNPVWDWIWFVWRFLQIPYFILYFSSGWKIQILQMSFILEISSPAFLLTDWKAISTLQ